MRSLLRTLLLRAVERALDAWLGPWAKIPDGYGHEPAPSYARAPAALPIAEPAPLAPEEEDVVLRCQVCGEGCKHRLSDLTLSVWCVREGCGFVQVIEREPIVIGRGVWGSRGGGA